MTESRQIKTTGRIYRKFLVIGDIHGTFDGLVRILNHARLIDREHNWTGGRTQVVQCGDIVDRGPASDDCLNLLLKLRQQSRKAGGRVDLLVGNHELALAREDYSLTDLANPQPLGKKLNQVIRRGSLQAARAYRQYLITHAGVSDELLNILMNRIRQQSPKRVTVAALARYLNLQLKEAFRHDDFTHPMFHIGRSRGGSHEGGGIFWADFDFEHNSEARHPRVWQIFGHTPPQESGRPFRVSPDRRRVNIDVGICEHYGGHLAYVKLTPNGITGIHCGESIDEQELLASLDEPLLV